MTGEQLKQELATWTKEQLEQDATVYIVAIDEFYQVEQVSEANGKYPDGGILEHGHKYLVI